MNRKLISGLMALQMAAAITVSAQTYTFKIGNQQNSLRVADHIGGEALDNLTGLDQTLEAYNLDLGDQKLVGLIRFEGSTGSMMYATHYSIPNSSDYLKVLKGYQILPKKLFVVGERIASDGSVKSAALLQYDKDNGQIIKAVEFPNLPDGLHYNHVFDVMESFAVDSPIHILCTTVNSDGNPQIAEIDYYATTGGFYNVRVYKEVNPPKEYTTVHYVRSYHYGSVSLTDPAIYGLLDDGKEIAAFCYYNNIYPWYVNTVYEKYHLTSLKGIKGITGVQMNGSYGDSGNHYRIEMAFTDNEGGICIQQKDEMVITNWQRFYQFPNKEEFRLGGGRDGHGTKMGPGSQTYNGRGYFLGAWMPYKEPGKSQVTALHFDGDNGNLSMPRVYNITGKGIFDNGSFPSTTYDPGYYYGGDYVNNYSFIADDVDQPNAFHYGTGNTIVNGNFEFFCSTPIKIDKARDKRLETEVVDMYRYTTDIDYPQELPLEAYNIDVEITLDCEAEHDPEGKLRGSNSVPNNIKLGMDPKQINIEASNKEIASVQIFSIDGRSIATMENVASLHFNHKFNKALVPGIYVVQIVYTDRSKEVKKVSIY